MVLGSQVNGLLERFNGLVVALLKGENAAKIPANLRVGRAQPHRIVARTPSLLVFLKPRQTNAKDRIGFAQGRVELKGGLGGDDRLRIGLGFHQSLGVQPHQLGAVLSGTLGITPKGLGCTFKDLPGYCDIPLS